LFDIFLNIQIKESYIRLLCTNHYDDFTISKIELTLIPRSKDLIHFDTYRMNLFLKEKETGKGFSLSQHMKLFIYKDVNDIIDYELVSSKEFQGLNHNQIISDYSNANRLSCYLCKSHLLKSSQELEYHEEMKTISILRKCSHAFHKNCLEEIKYSGICPFLGCNEEINDFDVEYKRNINWNHFEQVNRIQ
jgi:hypothetical protein